MLVRNNTDETVSLRGRAIAPGVTVNVSEIFASGRGNMQSLERLLESGVLSAEGHSPPPAPDDSTTTAAPEEDPRVALFRLVVESLGDDSDLRMADGRPKVDAINIALHQLDSDAHLFDATERDRLWPMVKT